MQCGKCTLTYTVAESLVCMVDGKVKKPEAECSRKYKSCKGCQKQHNTICRLLLKKIPDIEEVPDWCPKKN